MSTRDDLAALIVSTWDAPPPPVWSSHIWEQLADAILDAGWRPPARVITTREEEQALPRESLLRFANGCITGPGAVYFGGPPALPAVVLWEPGDDDE